MPSHYAGAVADDESPTLGEIIRRQRELNELSMRQLAAMVGISNPYLSQIERGLREPSDRVVDAIARTLRMSADSLYEQAGLLGEDEQESEVVIAIKTDPDLTERQRRSLIEIYEALVAETSGRRGRRRRKGT
jgi:transcriptional regulator with XRE-family HTH domain